jgi:hypothetical protein
MLRQNHKNDSKNYKMRPLLIDEVQKKPLHAAILPRGVAGWEKNRDGEDKENQVHKIRLWSTVK